MPDHQEIAQMSAAELRRRIGKRELSPLEVAEACLAQVERLNPFINAVVTLSDNCLEQAQEAEKRLMRGEDTQILLGLPVGIKDVTPVAGLRTTYGSPLYADHVPTQDALVVRRLKEAGAIIIGKTNTPEFAAGGHTFNEVFGRTCNPWNTKLTPGGSTGGGAAGLATGMFALAEGTDLGGSLRIPASFCGVVGLRPSPGLVPTYPSDYLWDTLNVTGAMARRAEDVALMLQAVSGPSPMCPICQPIAGRDFVVAVQSGIPKKSRLAYCPDIAGIGVDENIEQVCRKAAHELANAGTQVEEIELDLAFARDVFLTLRGYWMVAHHYKRLDRIDMLGSNLSGNVRFGLRNTAKELGAAEQARSKIWQIFRDLFEKYDHLLTPCVAVPPFSVEQNYPQKIAGKKMKTYVDWIAPTFILSLTGLPVASVPCGLDKDNLPVGLQIVGQQMGEESVLALAKVLQDMHPIGLPEIMYA